MSRTRTYGMRSSPRSKRLAVTSQRATRLRSRDLPELGTTMTTIYAVSFAVGFLALLAWIALAASARSVEGWSERHPDRRLGRMGRPVVAGILGFGMAGLSATFAGWTSAVAAVGAIAGGLILAVVADRLGDRPT